MKRRPIVLFQYKPQVPLDYSKINPYYITEVLIQGYYCIKKFTPIIHCLTDADTWQYLRMEHGVGDSLNIVWTHSFKDEMVSRKHVEFLYQAIKPIIDNIIMKDSIVQAMSTSSSTSK